jgi:rhodanese-related sulfurtransferase
VIVGILATNSLAAGVPRMTKEELKTLIGNSDVVIIDGRTPKHWNFSDSKIVGAVREDPSAVFTWTGKYPKDKTIVIYCA